MKGEKKYKSNEWQADRENAPDMHDHKTSRQGSISRIVYKGQSENENQCPWSISIFPLLGQLSMYDPRLNS